MLSEQGSLKTPLMTTPSLTRTGFFIMEPSTRDNAMTLGLDANKKASVVVIPGQRGAESLSDMGSFSSTLEVSNGHSDPFLDEPDRQSEEYVVDGMLSLGGFAVQVKDLANSSEVTASSNRKKDTTPTHKRNHRRHSYEERPQDLGLK